ncbi:unnamed protein product [Camellia sinensis]
MQRLEYSGCCKGGGQQVQESRKVTKGSGGGGAGKGCSRGGWVSREKGELGKVFPSGKMIELGTRWKVQRNFFES